MIDLGAKLGGHLTRLGGVIVRPRSTLLAILRGEEGSIWELFPWIVIACAAAAPIRAGRALLMFRVDVLAGLRALLSLLAGRMSAGLIGALIAASILYLLRPEKDGEGVHFDRALDASLFMLVPFLLLMAIGAGCSALGAEMWFMPHRRLGGVWWVLSIRAAVAYGWSAALFFVVAWNVRR